MNLRFLVIVVLLLLLALFAAINWPAFSAVDELNLVFTTVQAPLGLILLGVIAFLTVLYLLFGISLRTSALVETKRYAKELEEARRVANEVEASRISALRETVEGEMTSMRETLSAEAEAVMQRLDESENVLTAHLAQIDDYIKTGGVGSTLAGSGSERGTDYGGSADAGDTDRDAG